MLALALYLAAAGTTEPWHLVGMSARGAERYGLELRRGGVADMIEASSPQQCRERIERLRDDVSPTVVRTGAAEFVAQLGRLRSGAFTLHDTADRVCAPLDDPHDSVGIELAVVSAVGPWITVSERVSEARAGGPPYHEETWRTYDARTGSEGSVLDVVDERALVVALTSDPWIAGRLAHVPQALADASHLAEVFAILEQHGAVHDLGAFAFVDWDEGRGRVALRLAFRADLYGLGTNPVRQLGLWVRPRRSAIEHLRAARMGDGHWMREPPIRID